MFMPVQYMSPSPTLITSLSAGPFSSFKFIIINPKSYSEVISARHLRTDGNVQNCPSKHSPERKFNILLYVLAELPNSSYRFLRQQGDLGSIASIFSGIVPSFESKAIRHHYHLGKFHQESTSPRPILVKLNRTSEVASLLFKRNLLKSPYFIKPDCTPPKGHMEAALLKQRWSLINTGLNRSCIYVRGRCVFVNGQQHAKYQENQFDFSNPYSSTSLTSNQTL